MLVADMARINHPGSVAPMTARFILTHARIAPILKQQALTMLAIYVDNQRTSATFATQQRWLLSHLAIAQFFESGEIVTARFTAAAEAHRISSRNTADAFLKENEKYGIVVAAQQSADARTKPYRLPESLVSLIGEWCGLHLTTLDALDGGARRGYLRDHPEIVARLQPAFTREILTSRPIREPDPAFSRFIWLNDGGVVMDWLIAGMEEQPDSQGRILTSVTSISELGQHIKLSRSHLATKLREAEKAGDLGWSGERGKSHLWLSTTFRNAYHFFQASKLEAISKAFYESVNVPERTNTPKNRQQYPTKFD